uniref:Uncharacterized protein n=1 Tax=Oryza meridionalis TaxID=40149 RepID=A0A0E0E3V2_9ORYZ
MGGGRRLAGADGRSARVGRRRNAGRARRATGGAEEARRVLEVTDYIDKSTTLSSSAATATRR